MTVLLETSQILMRPQYIFLFVPVPVKNAVTLCRNAEK